MAIEHRNYFEGGVQSLAFQLKKGKKASVGVVSPGSWDFGTAKSPERITVLTGKLKINGHKMTSGSTPIYIQVGDQIVFEAKKHASYLCEYD